MNTNWLAQHPEKESLLMRLGVPLMFNTQRLPNFQARVINMRNLAMYEVHLHQIVFNAIYLNSMTDDRFSNVLFHELGHATSHWTNRRARMYENTGWKRESIYATEEVIAETLAHIFTCSVYGDWVSPVMSVKYINEWNKGLPIAWGEIEVAISTCIRIDQQERFFYFAKLFREFATRYKIFKTTEGVYV